MAEAVIRVGGDERYRFHVSYGEAVDVEINGRKRASCRVAAAELKGNVTAPPNPPIAEVGEGVDRRQERNVTAIMEAAHRIERNVRKCSESALESAQTATKACGQANEMVKEVRTLHERTEQKADRAVTEATKMAHGAMDYRDAAERFRDECREITENYGEQSETIQELRAENKRLRNQLKERG